MGEHALTIAIGMRMRELREAQGLGRGELALATGISKSTLARVESGTTGVTSDVLEKAIAGLGITVADFFNDELFRGAAPTAIPPSRRIPNPNAAVLEVLRRNPRASTAVIMEVTGLSHSTVERSVATLKLEGKLIRHGNRRTGHWEVVATGV